MSDDITTESPPSPPKSQLHRKPADLLSDVVLWRRKQLNVVILLTATASWIVMEVYQYNFVTVLSWVAMAIVVCLFFWGSIHRLLKKEAPDLSEIEISEETAMEHADSFRQWAEEGVRLMLHVSTEREWFVFAGVVGFLYIISVVANHFHLLTLTYIGVVLGMTVPSIYVKNEPKIVEFTETQRMRARRLYSVMKDKYQEMRNKIGGQRRKEIEKEKKQE
ncbi:hypothetical protein OROGR_006974 [Orobanche gracilis]